jgi:hypothetical protein
MKERGYPTEDDEQVLADLSVEHAQTVGHFRSAREITVNVASGDAATEDLRQALIHYRALFSDLLGGPADELPGTATDTPADTVPADTATPVDTVPADSATPVDTVPADTVAADGATPVDTAPADMVAADAVTPADTAPAGPVADTDQDDLVTETPAEARAEASPR